MLSPQDIQYHFLQGLRSKANLSADIPNGCTWGGIITRDTLIDLGKHISASIPKEKRKGDLSPLEIGFNNLNFELSKIENLLGEGSDPNKYLEGKYFKAIGKAEWEDFRWDGSISDKKTIINNAHFVFTASPTVEQANKGKDSLITQNVNGRLLHCSDAHKFAQDTNKTSPKELGHCYTWIKSDTTFEGLKQTIFEPERIKIHSSKPEDKEKYRVIDSIKLSSDTFWNQTIHLNPNLNVIIGGRSTGKSTLLKSIALVTNPNNTELDSLECDFVKEHLDNVEVLWADGANTPRDIDFFRQNYMHEIAKDKEQTDNLILRILKDKSIYSIWQDYQIFCSNNKAEIQSLINKVFDTKKQINNKLIDLKEKGDKEGISKEINDLNQKISSIKSQLDISPEEMKLYEDIMKLITDNANKIKTVNCYMEELNKLKVFPFINSSFDTQLVSLSSYLKVALKIKIQDCQHDCLENIKSEIDKYIKELLQDVYSLNSTLEFADISLKYEEALLHLINRSIEELASYKNIQWVGKDRFFRFKPIGVPRERKITWKNKKTATRTVVAEIWNNEKKQILYFRQLSFRIQSFRSDEKWFISITPGWSFTYDGYSSCKQESQLIAQKKNLETNSAVYQHFMFISFCLSNKLEDNESEYKYISFSSPFDLKLNYTPQHGY